MSACKLAHMCSRVLTDHLPRDGALDKVQQRHVVDHLREQACRMPAKLRVGEAHGVGGRRRDSASHCED
jgi:hypothetical protein